MDFFLSWAAVYKLLTNQLPSTAHLKQSLAFTSAVVTKKALTKLPPTKLSP